MLLSSCKTLFNQQASAPSRDLATLNMLNRGRQLMDEGRYGQAAVLFADAADRAFNQSTTASIYLAGLAYFKDGKGDAARLYFDRLASKYPKSRYIPESQYHIALMKLQSTNDWESRQAITDLFEVSEKAKELSLRRDAEASAKNFLFYEASLPWLRRYEQVASDKYYSVVLEALSYQLVQNGQAQDARTYYETYLSRGGRKSNFLETLFSEKGIEAAAPVQSILRLALFLPLDLEEPTLSLEDQIPDALHFYEGFDLALKEARENLSQRIYIKLFDTRGDTSVTKYQLEQLAEYEPDMVIGAFGRSETEFLSVWAEENQIPLLVPRLPFFDMVRGKQYTFLAHPSIRTQGAKAAEYVVSELNLRKALVWSDENVFTEDLATGFDSTFIAMGGTTSRAMIPGYVGDYSQDDLEDIVKLVDRNARKGFDVWYIPITANEVAAGLILAQLNKNPSYASEINVIGSPQWWTRYDEVDRELKETFALKFTTSSFVQEEDTSYRKFHNLYLRSYEMLPDQKDLNIQGYDLGVYITQMLNDYNNPEMPLASFIRSYPPVKGIHIDYYFGGQQDNQIANVAAFDKEGVKRIDNFMERYQAVFLPDDIEDDTESQNSNNRRGRN